MAQPPQTKEKPLVAIVGLPNTGKSQVAELAARINGRFAPEILRELSQAGLIELTVGDEGRVAFIQCERDERLHRLDALNIRPGATIKLHQTFPSYVIECESAKIALERKAAESIHVWIGGEAS